MEILDELFGLLSEKRRRYALYYLEQQDEPIPLEELTEQVAEWESGAAATSVPEETFREIRVELHHTELPEAAEARYVRYNRSEKIVELAGEPPEFDAVISVAKVIERPDRNP